MIIDFSEPIAIWEIGLAMIITANGGNGGFKDCTGVLETFFQRHRSSMSFILPGYVSPEVYQATAELDKLERANYIVRQGGLLTVTPIGINYFKEHLAYRFHGAKGEELHKLAAEFRKQFATE